VDPVLVEKRGSALWITLNRPDKRNAFNAEVLAGIGEGWRRANADPEVRAVVLTGAGEKAFCAGGDLQPGQAFAFDCARPSTDYADLVRAVARSTVPSFDARAALAAGLVNHVVPVAELDAKVEGLVSKLAASAPTAIRRGKYAIRAMAGMGFEEALAYAEAQIAVMPQTEDAREGLAAFNEKRRPRWTGR